MGNNSRHGGVLLLLFLKSSAAFSTLARPEVLSRAFSPLQFPPAVFTADGQHILSARKLDAKQNFSFKLRMADPSPRNFRILIADKISSQVRDALQEAGHDVIFDAALNGDSLRDSVTEQKPHVLVVRSTRVEADVIASHSGLELVIRAGSGVDNVDLEQAKASDVRVANCAGANAVAVAELTLGLILACDRQIPAQDADLKRGKWRKGVYSTSTRNNGLKGRTLGIVGYGSIGQAVGRMAQAFGMRVQAWSRSLSPDSEATRDVEVLGSLEELAATSDIVTVHAASSESPLIDAEFLAAMKAGAILVNTARGSVVDEVALLKAVDSKGLRVGLDVYAEEPAAQEEDFECAIAKRPEAVATHHIGASTQQAQDAVGEVLLDVVASFRVSGTADTIVV